MLPPADPLAWKLKEGLPNQGMNRDWPPKEGVVDGGNGLGRSGMDDGRKDEGRKVDHPGQNRAPLALFKFISRLVAHRERVVEPRGAGIRTLGHHNAAFRQSHEKPSFQAAEAEIVCLQQLLHLVALQTFRGNVERIIITCCRVTRKR